MYPVSRPDSAIVPTLAEAVEPIAHRILAVLLLSASSKNPTAFAGAVKVEAVVVTAALLEIDPFVFDVGVTLNAAPKAERIEESVELIVERVELPEV